MKDLISENLTELNGRIAEACEKYDRDADDITIVAVTKTHPASVIKTAVAVGLHEIGESRIQDAEPKIIEVGAIARYHLIGHLQTNKVKKAISLFDLIQSIDSLKLAEEINRRCGEAEKTIECFIEVNCSGEDQKFGVMPDQAISLIEKVNDMSNINLTGMMTIAPFVDDEKAIRIAFSECRQIFKKSRDIVGVDFEHLSMGMTSDFELAIAEGSTMLRLGTSLFGPRRKL